MRDYSILVSAYLLEGKTKSGIPRSTVPRNIGVPFTTIAAALNEPSIMRWVVWCVLISLASLILTTYPYAHVHVHGG